MEQRYISLAPTNLPNQATTRYDGSGFSAKLQDFSPADRERLTAIYKQIKSIYDLWLYMKEAPQYSVLKKNVEAIISDEFVCMGKDLALDFNYNSERMAKILHDIRGGAMTSMIGYADRISMQNLYRDVDTMRSFVFLARDQAKMLRNAVEDIDPHTRAADERIRIHSVYDYVKKWHNFEHRVQNRRVVVKVRCYFEGNVTTSCLEASALDRVVYNLINNALRFAEGEEVVLTIFPIGNILRWVVENTVSAEQESWLRQHLGDNLQALFQGGLSNGGNGIGLSNCADLVGASFGVSSEDAIKQGYITAKLIDRTFYACFHWNAVAEE
jgi:signal transduction histidine kinase